MSAIISAANEEGWMRSVEIEYLLLVHVLDEVGLALELPLNLLGVHRRQRPLLGLGLEGGFHISFIRNYRKTRRRDIDL